MDVTLNSAEKELLQKLGINIDTLKAAKRKTKQLQDDNKRPITIDLTGISEQVNVVCKCCGKKSVYFQDYVKRVDMEGYTLVSTNKPANPIKRERNLSTNKCIHCGDEKLVEYNQGALIQMVKNLRKV
jgi:hypothetical protein